MIVVESILLAQMVYHPSFDNMVILLMKTKTVRWWYELCPADPRSGDD